MKNKTDKYLTPVSKDVYVDKLEDIVDKYNDTYHRTIKTKPIDVKSNIYIEFYVENNKKDLQFKVGGHVRISTFENIVARGHNSNWPGKGFVIKKVKNTRYIILDKYNGRH